MLGSAHPSPLDTNYVKSQICVLSKVGLYTIYSFVGFIRSILTYTTMYMHSLGIWETMREKQNLSSQSLYSEVGGGDREYLDGEEGSG